MPNDLSREPIKRGLGPTQRLGWKASPAVAAFLLCWLLASFPVLTLAQSTGAVEGSVRDPSSAFVAGAKLTLTNTATGVAQNTVSQNSGEYHFDYLNPGTYSLQVVTAGFKTARVEGIVVEVGKTTSVNVSLQLGQVNQQVTVTSTTDKVLVDTVDAEVSTNVPRAFIDELPTLSRDALAYADMAPGVTINVQATAGAAASLCITCGTTANINGAREGRSDYYMDGTDNVGSYRNYSLQFPNPDAIQEVQVSTANTSPEYGRQMGGAINVITKSGTNQFHGDAFFFFRPKFLDANDAGNDYYSIPKVADHLKEWGGTLGGPIIKNKTFFFASYQRFTDSTENIQNGVQPGTPAMMQGDFGGLLSPTPTSNLAPVQLYDPNCPGQTCPVPGNNLITYISPATKQSLLNPVGLALGNLLPTVANYGDHFVWAYQKPLVNNEILGKVDHNFNDANHLSVSLFRTWGTQTLPGLQNDWGNAPNWGPELDTTNQNSLAVRHTWTISSNKVLESAFDLAVFNADRGQTKLGKDLSDFGAENVPLTAVGARKYLPQLYFNGLSAADGWLSKFNQHNYRFGSTVTWIHDKHDLKFGVNFQHNAVIQYNDQDTGGIAFSGAFATGVFGTNNCCPVDTGSGLADLLMGLASPNYNGNGIGSGFQQSGILDYDVHNWNYYFFAQDAWKVSPRLTLTPGLRYEIYQPVGENNNKIAAFVPGFQSTLYPNAPLGYAFSGDPGIPSGLYNIDYTDVAPRLGIAWDPKGDSRTAIRAGIGVFYSASPLQLNMLTAEQPPWHPSAQCTTTLVSNPWLECNAPGAPGGQSFSSPPTPFSVSSQSLGALNWAQSIGTVGAVGYAPNFKTPYSIQWNISVQHTLPHNITFSTGYVGNHGTRENENIPINYARYSSTATLDPANVLSRQPYSNPPYVYAGTGAPIYSNGLIQQTVGAENYYDGWQSTLEMRTFRSLQLRASYEYARGRTNDENSDINDSSTNVADPVHPFSEWGEYLIRNTFKAFYLWNAPSFPARDRMLNKIAGGWRFSGDLHVYSGFPQNVTLGYDWAYDGLGTERPDLVGQVHYVHQISQQGFIQYLDLGSTNGQPGQANGYPIAQRGPFVLPGGGTNHAVYGNTPLNYVFLPGNWTADLALLKDFHITERQYFEFRLESTNLFNHPVWGSLDSTYTDTTFGQLTYPYGSRLMQVGLKYYF